MIPILFRINTNPERRKHEKHEAPEPDYFYPHGLFKAQSDEEYATFYASMSRKDKRRMVTSRIIPSANFQFDMPDDVNPLENGNDPFSVIINPATGLTWGKFLDTIRGLSDDEVTQRLEAAQTGMSEENAKAAIVQVVTLQNEKTEWLTRQHYYYRCIKDISNELHIGLWPDMLFEFRHGDHILRAFKYKLKGERLRYWLHEHGIKFSRGAWAVLLDRLHIRLKNVTWIKHDLQDASGNSLFSIEAPAECADLRSII